MTEPYLYLTRQQFNHDLLNEGQPEQYDVRVPQYYTTHQGKLPQYKYADSIDRLRSNPYNSFPVDLQPINYELKCKCSLCLRRQQPKCPYECPNCVNYNQPKIPRLLQKADLPEVTEEALKNYQLIKWENEMKRLMKEHNEKVQDIQNQDQQPYQGKTLNLKSNFQFPKSVAAQNNRATRQRAWITGDPNDRPVEQQQLPAGRQVSNQDDLQQIQQSQQMENKSNVSGASGAQRNSNQVQQNNQNPSSISNNQHIAKNSSQISNLSQNLQKNVSNAPMQNQSSLSINNQQQQNQQQSNQIDQQSALKSVPSNFDIPQVEFQKVWQRPTYYQYTHKTQYNNALSYFGSAVDKQQELQNKHNKYIQGFTQNFGHLKEGLQQINDLHKQIG